MSHFLQTQSHLFGLFVGYSIPFGTESRGKKFIHSKRRLLHSMPFGVSCICFTYTSIQGTANNEQRKKRIPSTSILLPKLTNAYDPCICVGECVPQTRLLLYVHSPNTRTAFLNVWHYMHTQRQLRLCICICGEVKCNNDDW